MRRIVNWCDASTELWILCYLHYYCMQYLTTQMKWAKVKTALIILLRIKHFRGKICWSPSERSFGRTWSCHLNGNGMSIRSLCHVASRVTVQATNQSSFKQTIIFSKCRLDPLETGLTAQLCMSTKTASELQQNPVDIFFEGPWKKKKHKT